MNDIKYVCSLGTLCHTAYFLKRNRLKYFSYPFDWIFSNINTISDCVTDNFAKFLDKDNYTDHISNNPELCGHKYYGDWMFNHKSPRNEEHYNYYVRCVDRFRDLLLQNEKKLFVIMVVNNEFFRGDDNDVIKLNKKLLNYTNNFKILCILHHPNNFNNDHTFIEYEDIDFLELYTKSVSDGINFIDENDNIYLDNILKSKYNFCLIKNNEYTNDDTP